MEGQDQHITLSFDLHIHAVTHTHAYMLHIYMRCTRYIYIKRHEANEQKAKKVQQEYSTKHCNQGGYKSESLRNHWTITEESLAEFLFFPHAVSMKMAAEIYSIYNKDFL